MLEERKNKKASKNLWKVYIILVVPCSRTIWKMPYFKSILYFHFIRTHGKNLLANFIKCTHDAIVNRVDSMAFSFFIHSVNFCLYCFSIFHAKESITYGVGLLYFIYHHIHSFPTLIFNSKLIFSPIFPSAVRKKQHVSCSIFVCVHFHFTNNRIWNSGIVYKPFICDKNVIFVLNEKKNKLLGIIWFSIWKYRIQCWIVCFCSISLNAMFLNAFHF